MSNQLILEFSIMSTDQIVVLSSRVESLEYRLDTNTKNIDSKLDQLVELMTKVTQLQEREARNADDIQDIRVSLREFTHAMDAMNRRWHERLDLNAKEMDLCRAKLATAFAEEHKEVEEKVEEVKKISTETDKELSKWLNRGIGAWIVGGFLIVLLQSWGAWVITAAADKVKEMDAKIVQVDAKVNTLETLVGKIPQ